MWRCELLFGLAGKGTQCGMRMRGERSGHRVLDVAYFRVRANLNFRIFIHISPTEYSDLKNGHFAQCQDSLRYRRPQTVECRVP